MSLTAWVISITAAIAVGTLADIILADGNTKKFVKSVTALIVFAVIIAPLPKLFGGSFDAETILSETENQQYLAEVAISKAEFKAENLERKLESIGVKKAEVVIHLTGYDSDSETAAVIVDISASGSVSASDSEIKAFAAAYLSVDTNKVFITGRNDGKNQGTD